MNRYVLLGLLFWSVTAMSQSANGPSHASDYVAKKKSAKVACISIHEISMGPSGEDLEVRSINDPADIVPESALFFDFTNMTVMYPWINFETEETFLATDALQKVNDHLYYSLYNDGGYENYSTYLFDETKESVHLTELGFLSMYICEPGDMKDIERKYRLDFSDYK